MELFGFDLSGAVTFLFQFIGVIFNFVFGLFLILAGYLLNVATTFNFNILSDSNAILKTGWLAARDIANLGFVILAMGSALATVLHYPPEYDVRKLLPKFIAAAILVNFSMTLAAIPIQFSNVLTGFFLSRVTAVNNLSLVDLAGPLVGILGPQKLLTGESDPLPPEPGDSAGGAISSVIFASLATLMFNIIFTLLMAILLLAFAIMLISRYFILTFLIIFAPLACLFYIFPALKDKFSLWNSEYIKWVFIGPGMMFFVYMAITVAEKLPSTAIKGNNTFLGIPGLGALFEQFINLSFITAILVFGLIAASKTGTAAGKAALGAANGIGNGTKKFFKNQATKFADKDGKFGQSFQKGLKFASEKLKVEEGDSAGKKFLKRFGATSGVGQAVALAGGHEKGIYGSLIGGGLVGSGIKSDKEKKPETRKDVEKELGELQTKRAKMVKDGLDLKDVDEKIKFAQRKLYRFRKEDFEADYMQSTEDELDKAIKASDQGKQPKGDKKPTEEVDIRIGVEDLDVEKQANKIVDAEKDIEKKVKQFTKGLLEDENNEKSDVIQTVSRKKLEDEKGIISEKVNKLKELKKTEKDENKLKIYEKALGIMQNVEYALSSEIKKREEEIQVLGTIRKNRNEAKRVTERVLGLNDTQTAQPTEKKSGLVDQYGNPY